VCEPLMPDVMAPKAHQNNRRYVSSADLPSDSEFSMVGGYTENPEKPQNCQNWGVGTCAGMGTCPDNTVLQLSYDCLLPCTRATPPPSPSHPNIVACNTNMGEGVLVLITHSDNVHN